MVRKGIYVNGKEIAARYVGNKLVWRKSAGQWTLVKNFSFGANYYTNDYSTYTIVTMETNQYMGGTPPRLTPSETYLPIQQSYPGEYKIKMPYIDVWAREVEFILDGITISNRQNRRHNHLSISFKFQTIDDRERFMRRLSLSSDFELYRKG